MTHVQFVCREHRLPLVRYVAATHTFNCPVGDCEAWVAAEALREYLKGGATQ